MVDCGETGAVVFRASGVSFEYNRKSPHSGIKRKRDVDRKNLSDRAKFKADPIVPIQSSSTNHLGLIEASAREPLHLGPFDWEIHKGESWVILGPNGAGKSTLLRLMAGLIQPCCGFISLLHRRLERYSLLERARTIAWLPQQHSHGEVGTVRETVLLSRHPHQSGRLFENADDAAAVAAAMDSLSLSELSDRPIASLSGGERQRVALAAAVAQETPIFIADEPTAFLDVKHQLATFSFLADLAKRGCTVIAATHDVNLARRCFTHAIVLLDGQAIGMGPVYEVLTPSVLSRAFRVAWHIAHTGGDIRHSWLIPAMESGE